MAKFKRILLKLSGESLMGKQSFGIDPERLSDYAKQIKEVHEMGVQIGIVIGGGNIFRGLSGSQKGFDRVKGDQMGMCATVINSLALSSALGALGVKNKVLTAIRMEPIGEFYTKWKAIEAMEAGYICIFSAGTGSPYFTTDTGSSLRGIEIEADVKDVLVPTTSEVLWGVINGDILSTLWQKITANTDSLLSLGLRQVGSLVGEPYASIFRYIGGGATYVCYVNGSQVAFTTNVKYPVLVGGVAARRETTGSVRTMVQLMPMKIDQVGAASVMSNGTRFEMADDAQVYLWYKGQYYATKLTEVNSEGYYLTGWYDNFGCAAGKRVRVIVAVKKD